MSRQATTQQKTHTNLYIHTHRDTEKNHTYIYNQPKTMAPLGGGSRDGSKHSSHPLSRLVGSSSSALFELIIFHPIDTAAKRIITHQGRLLTAEGLSLSSKFSKMGAVVFQVCVYVCVNIQARSIDCSLWEGRGAAREVNIFPRIHISYVRLLLTSCINTHTHTQTHFKKQHRTKSALVPSKSSVPSSQA